ILVAVLSLFILKPELTRSIIRMFPKGIGEWLLKAYDHFYDGLHLGFGIWQLFLTGVVWLGALFAYWIFLQLDGSVALGWNSVLIVYLVATLGLTVTVTPGGLGTFEAVVSAVLVAYGYTWESAFLSSIGLRIAGTLPIAVLALYTIFIDGFDLFGAMKMKSLLSEGRDERQ
ncbi:MAG: lysylphosphatidylglycerol synthase domain-containing protein, partial [Pseudomonadales bacterium]